MELSEQINTITVSGPVAELLMKLFMLDVWQASEVITHTESESMHQFAWINLEDIFTKICSRQRHCCKNFWSTLFMYVGYIVGH